MDVGPAVQYVVSPRQHLFMWGFGFHKPKKGSRERSTRGALSQSPERCFAKVSLGGQGLVPGPRAGRSRAAQTNHSAVRAEAGEPIRSRAGDTEDCQSHAQGLKFACQCSRSEIELGRIRLYSFSLLLTQFGSSSLLLIFWHLFVLNV